MGEIPNGPIEPDAGGETDDVAATVAAINQSAALASGVPFPEEV